MNKKKVLSLVTAASILASSVPTFAAVTDYVTKDDKGVTYSYSKLELEQSIIDNTDLSKKYSAERLIHLLDSKNGYINRLIVEQALIDNKNLDVDSFTEREDIKTEKIKVDNKVTIGEDGKVVVVPVEEEKLKLKVESVSVIDATTVEVTFAEDAEVTEADLEDSAITLTAGEESVDANFVSLTNKVGLYELAEDQKIVDATEYTVTGNKIQATTFVAVFGEEKVSDFTFVTSGINATETPGDTDEHTLEYKVLNQYGKEIDVTGTDKYTATVKKGAFPIASKAEGNTLTITGKLVEGDVLTITIQDKENKEAKETVEITVGKFAAQEATKVTKVEAKEAADVETLKDLKAGDTFDLKATVVDQNNKTMDSEKVRWVSSDKDVVTFDTDGDVNFEDGVSVKFLAKSEGTATITAFTMNGKASKAYEVTVGQGKLDQIDASVADVEVKNKKTTTVYVNEVPEDVESTKIVKFQNDNTNNIPVKAADINVEVTTAVKDFDASEVRVEKVADKDGNLVAFEITSNRTTQTAEELKGNYGTGAVYAIKLSTADEDVTAATFDVTSKIDATVTEIVTDSNVEYRKDVNPTKEITFKNKNGEVINVVDTEVKFIKDDAAIELQKTLKDKFVKAESGDVVTGLKYNIAADQKVVVVVGTTTTDVNVKITEEAELSTIALGSNITTGVISGDADFVLPITLKDQDGNAFIPATLDDFKVEYSDVATFTDAFKLSYYNTNDDDEIVTDEVVKADAEGVALVAQTTTGSAGSFNALTEDKTFTGVQVTDGEETDPVKSNKISVKVKAARVLKTVTLDKKSVVLTEGSEAKVVVEAKDQYGDLIEVSSPTTNITLDSEATVKVSTETPVAAAKDDKGVAIDGKYIVTLETVKAGTEEVAVKVVLDSVTLEAKLNATVKSAGDVVSVDFTNEDLLHINDLSDDSYNTVTLAMVGTDSEGSKVSVKASDFAWTTDLPEFIKFAPATGIFTVEDLGDGEEYPETATGTVTAYQNGEAAGTFTINFTSELPKLTDLTVQKDFKTVEVAEGEQGESLTAIKLDAKYNLKGVEPKEIGGGDVTWTSSNSAVTVSNGSDGKITVAEGTEVGKKVTLTGVYEGKVVTVTVEVVPAAE